MWRRRKAGREGGREGRFSVRGGGAGACFNQHVLRTERREGGREGGRKGGKPNTHGWMSLNSTPPPGLSRHNIEEEGGREGGEEGREKRKLYKEEGREGGRGGRSDGLGSGLHLPVARP
jgi:hypothetical protein